jgi:aspartate racemase
MNRIIMDELVCGVTTPTGIAYFLAVIQRLKERDCDAVILGCTKSRDRE